MGGRRLLACLVAPLVLAAALTAAYFLRTPVLSATLYDLIGSEAERIPRFLREASAGEVAIIVSSRDGSKAVDAAQAFEALPGARMNDIPPGALDFIRDNRGGLVTAATAELLTTREGRAKLAHRAVRRLYQSPVPPLLGFDDDPFGLTDDFIMSLSSPQKVGGFPVLVTNGVTRVLVKARFEQEQTGGLDAAIALEAQLRALAARAASEEVEIRLAGAPVHAARSALRSKREIAWLTWFSLLFIALLSLTVFRSWKWLPLLALSLFVSASAGALALVLLFRELHVMTLVMGTTVLGLVIDYSFHWLLSPAGDKPAIRRNLVVSFLTTELSLLPLALATIPVLRQSAVFLCVALAAQLAFVLFCYPKEIAAIQSPRAARLPSAFFTRRHPAAIVLPVLLLLVVSLVGLFRTQVRTELSSLYRPDAELLEAERQRAAFGEYDLASLPPLAQRQANAANVRALYDEHGAAMAEALDCATLVPPPEPVEDLLRPQALMARIFGAWTSEALIRLACSMLALLAALVLLCRGRAARIFLPPLVTILVVAGLFGWFSVPLNLFHILAAFLLLGMAVDYAVFLQAGERSAFLPAFSSLLTSLAGFGALAFVSFPVIASFGLVLALGLPLAFLLAFLARRRSPADCETVEKGATPLGLEILWLVYCVLGLRVLHLLATCVGLTLWLFSPAVRKASRSWRKVVFFTRSLADKLVVMAEGRQLPQVETDGSADAEAFLADVREGKGVFILSSHVGTIEVLTALGDCARTFHAWMDFDRTGVFNRFYLRHARRRRVVIHPISSFGLGTVFEAGDLIDAGDCLVMAGDRGEGAFRFAAAFDHPVYFVACLAEAGCRYRAVIRRLPSSRAEMMRAYGRFVSELIESHPDQHFTWGV